MPEPDSVAATQTPSVTSASRRLTAELPPFAVPDHTLVRRIGQGAYGEVWLARNALGAWRAVKFVRRSSFDDERPLEREFAGIQRFEPISRSHESQLNILHVGRAEDGFYYVMELADDMGRGQEIDEATYTPRNLRSELHRRGRLPAAECLRIGLALTTALEHLHKHGLVHRDIKPSNIVFVNGIPKLADIGLVARAEATLSFVGTEGFLPPEGPGTRPADIYSLGKVLYEISTGHDRHQFPELPTNIVELPDRADLSELNEVLLKACHRDPAQRYQTAAEMHADLALLESGRSVLRLRGIERRLEVAQRVGVAILLLTALIAGGWWWQARQTRAVRNLAGENARLAEGNAQLARESQQRVVRLAVANGARLLDKNDATGALLWFADVLPLMTNSPAEESIHRVRIQQVLQRTPRLLRVFAHEQGVLCAAFSPDGRHVATGTADSWRIWDAENGAVLLEQPGPRRRVQDLRYTHDGAKLFLRSCASENHAWRHQAQGYAAVLDAASGREVFPAITNIGPAAFSPDDHWLAVARTNLEVDLLDASTGRRAAVLTGHTESIFQLSFSLDGRLLASASRDRNVRVWRVPSGEPAGPPLRHIQPLIRAVFSPDGRRIATRTSTGRGEAHHVHTWWLADATEIGTSIQLSPLADPLIFDVVSGKRLFAGALPPEVRLFDADSHTYLDSLPGVSSMPRCWAFSPDGSRFALGSDGGTAHVWNVETGETLGPSLHHHGSVECVQFSPDGSRLLTAGEDGTAKLWDLATLAEAARPLELPGGVPPIQPDDFPHALSPDGRRLLLPLDAGTLEMVNLEPLARDREPFPWPDAKTPISIQCDASGRQWAEAMEDTEASGKSPGLWFWRQDGTEPRQRLLPHPQAVDVFRFSGDGAQLLTLGRDGRLRTWQTSDGSLSSQARLPGGCVWALAIAPDCRKAVFADEAGELILVDLRKPSAAGQRLEGATTELRASFSPDSHRLATVGNRQRGHVWDAETGQRLATIQHGQSPGHTLMWVEWSPDGRKLLTCGTGEVSLWDAANGRPLFAPMVHSLAVRTAHFSPDSRFFVTVGDDSTVQVWDAARAEPVTGRVNLQPPKPRAAMITADNRLITVNDPAVIRVWELAETRLPAETINQYVLWLAGRKLDPTGVLRELDVGEFGQLDARLRASHPELLTNSLATRREWHRRQVQEPTSLTRVAAAQFHLDRLSEMDRSDPWVQEQQARYRACQIPARPPDASTQQLDLTGFYTHSFEVLPHEELWSLPRGVHSLAGTRFDLRGLVRLEPRTSEFTIASFPIMALNRIPVRERCRKLHFLQGVDGDDARDGDEVARWVIHYANGTTREWPLVYGRHVRDWWLRTGVPQETPEAVVAWEGHSPLTRKARPQTVRLYTATWTNPLPDLEISHLDFVLGEANVRPFVVAITAE